MACSTVLRAQRVLLLAFCILAHAPTCIRAGDAVKPAAGEQPALRPAQPGYARQCAWVREAFMPEPHCDLSSGEAGRGPSLLCCARTSVATARAQRRARRAAQSPRQVFAQTGALPNPLPRPHIADPAPAHAAFVLSTASTIVPRGANVTDSPEAALWGVLLHSAAADVTCSERASEAECAAQPTCSWDADSVRPSASPPRPRARGSLRTQLCCRCRSPVRATPRPPARRAGAAPLRRPEHTRRLERAPSATNPDTRGPKTGAQLRHRPRGHRQRHVRRLPLPRLPHGEGLPLHPRRDRGRVQGGPRLQVVGDRRVRQVAAAAAAADAAERHGRRRGLQPQGLAQDAGRP